MTRRRQPTPPKRCVRGQDSAYLETKPRWGDGKAKEEACAMYIKSPRKQLVNCESSPWPPLLRIHRSCCLGPFHARSTSVASINQQLRFIALIRKENDHGLHHHPRPNADLLQRLGQRTTCGLQSRMAAQRRCLGRPDAVSGFARLPLCCT